MNCRFFPLLAVVSLNLYGNNSFWVHSERPLQAESTYEALESFETPLSGFFIRNHHDVPVVDFQNHRIRVEGLVQNPFEISVQELLRLPQKSFYAVLECSGNKRGLQIPTAGGIQWSEGAVGNAFWEGVPLHLLLEKAKPKKEARFITLRGADKPALPTTPEFVRSIPIEKAFEPDTLLALKMNRETLPLLHGGPVRLVLPGWYGQNWIKWVTHITLTSEEDSGFYMKKAYRMPKKTLKPGAQWKPEEGVPIQELLVQSLLVWPHPNTIVPRGKVTLKGKAFSGAGEISRVEISQNSGKTWKEARLLPSHPLGGWREFEFETELPKIKSYQFLSRATDTKGNIQPLKHAWNPAGYLRNAVSGVNIWAVDSDEFEGFEIYKSQCLTCHSEGLIASQKFEKKGWNHLLNKMKVFGAQVEPTEETKLIKFLLGLQKRNRGVQKLSSVDVEKIKFENPLVTAPESEETRRIYENNCAQCHGEEGQGKTGPRLRGRLIPKEIFLNAVMNGKNRMPAFGSSFKEDQILNLWGFLQRPN